MRRLNRRNDNNKGSSGGGKRKIPIPQSFGLGAVVIERQEENKKKMKNGEGDISIRVSCDNDKNHHKMNAGDHKKKMKKESSGKEESNDDGLLVSWDECLRLDGAMQCWFVTHTRNNNNNKRNSHNRNYASGMSITTCQRILSRHFEWFLQRTIPHLYTLPKQSTTTTPPLLRCQPSPSTTARLSTLKQCYHRTTTTNQSLYDVSGWIECHRQNQLSKQNSHPESSTIVSQTMPWLTRNSSNNNTNNDNNKSVTTVGMTLQQRIAAREQQRLQQPITHHDDNNHDHTTTTTTTTNDSLPLWRVADILQAYVQRKCRRMYNHQSHKSSSRMPLSNQLLETHSHPIQKIQQLIPTWIQPTTNNNNNNNNIQQSFTIPILSNAIYSKTIRIHLIPKSHANKQKPQKLLSQKNNNNKNNNINNNNKEDNEENNQESTIDANKVAEHDMKKRKRGSKLSLTNRKVEIKFPNHNEVTTQTNKKNRRSLGQPLTNAVNPETITTKISTQNKENNNHKKTRVLRVNPYLHLTEADIDGGINLNNNNHNKNNRNHSMHTSTPRGLKRLFHQMNTGHRI